MIGKVILENLVVRSECAEVFIFHGSCLTILLGLDSGCSSATKEEGYFAEVVPLLQFFDELLFRVLFLLVLVFATTDSKHATKFVQWINALRLRFSIQNGSWIIRVAIHRLLLLLVDEHKGLHLVGTIDDEEHLGVVHDLLFVFI